MKRVLLPLFLVLFFCSTAFGGEMNWLRVTGDSKLHGKTYFYDYIELGGEDVNDIATVIDGASTDDELATALAIKIYADGLGGAPDLSAEPFYTVSASGNLSNETVLSAGEGIDLSTGIISGEDATTTNKGIASFNSAHFSVSSGVVSPILANGSAYTHFGAVGDDTWNELYAAIDSSWPSGGSPAGNDGNIQYNNGGSFGGEDSLFWDDSNKRLGIGTVSPLNAIHVSGSLGVIRVSSHDDAANYSGQFYLAKSRGTATSETAIQSDDHMGLIMSLGYNGSGYYGGSRIDLQAAENFAPDHAGSRILFETIPNGTLNPIPSMTLDHDGKMILLYGTGVNEFSIDGTLGGDSDDAVPTEKAVKTYVDAAGGGVVPAGANYQLQYYNGGNLGANAFLGVDPTNGYLGVGPGTWSRTIANRIHIIGDSANNSRIMLERSSDDVGPAGIIFQKSRGTPSSMAHCDNGDQEGQIDFYGHVGTGQIMGARIEAVVQGVPATYYYLPTGLKFYTRPAFNDSGTTIEPRMMIDYRGYVSIPGDISADGIFHIQGDGTSNNMDIIFRQDGTSSVATYMYFDKINGTGVPSDGSELGSIIARSWDTDSYEQAAKIKFVTDGITANGDVPGMIEFYTTLDGTSTPLKRMAIWQDGNVSIGSNFLWDESARKLVIGGEEDHASNWALINIENDNDNATIRNITYSDTATQQAAFSAYHRRGTHALPTAVQSGDFLGGMFLGGGFGSGENDIFSSVQIGAYATENFSSGNCGSKLEFYTTDNGSATRDLRMTIDHDGEIGIGIGSPQGLFHVSGGQVIISDVGSTDDVPMIGFCEGSNYDEFEIVGDFTGVGGSGNAIAIKSDLGGGYLQRWRGDGAISFGGIDVNGISYSVPASGHFRVLYVDENGNVVVGDSDLSNND